MDSSCMLNEDNDEDYRGGKARSNRSTNLGTYTASERELQEDQSLMLENSSLDNTDLGV